MNEPAGSEEVAKQLDGMLDHLYDMYGPTLKGPDIDMLKQAAALLRQQSATIERLRGELSRLRACYADAIEDIESWGAYAGDFFREKHCFEERLADHRLDLDRSLAALEQSHD